MGCWPSPVSILQEFLMHLWSLFFPMKSLRKRWRCVFLHHISLDKYFLRICIHCWIMVLFPFSAIFVLSFDFLPLLLPLSQHVTWVLVAQPFYHSLEWSRLWHLSPEKTLLHEFPLHGYPWGFGEVKMKSTLLLHSIQVSEPWDWVLEISYLLR